MRKLNTRRLILVAGAMVISTVPIAAQTSSTRPAPGSAATSASISSVDHTLMNQALLVREVNLNGPVINGGISVEVQLQNLTQKTIVAFKYSLLVTYDDGTQATTGLTEDDLGSIAEAKVTARVPGRTSSDLSGKLSPAGIQKSSTFIKLGTDGARPVTATGTIDMLVYDDNTAIGDEGRIGMIFANRKQRSAEMAATIADLNAILADSEMKEAAANPDINEPNGTRRRILSQRIADRIAQLKQSPADTRGEVRELQYFFDSVSRGGFIISSALTKGYPWQFEMYQSKQAALAAGSVRKDAQ